MGSATAPVARWRLNGFRMGLKNTAEPRHAADIRGRFVRLPSVFRDWITADGSSEYPAEPGRYHLYVSRACPWAHRTVILRGLKRLEGIVGMTVVDPIRDHRGWRFSNAEGCEPDPVNGFEFLYEAYLSTDPEYASRVTVPLLWDKQTSRIVNNESSEIIRMFNSAFEEWGDASIDFYPDDLRDQIDEINAIVYTNVNNGVYKTGFAGTQEAYEATVFPLFETLEMIEQRLVENRYLIGDALTEADWRLFPTLVRFDAVYVGHFKCNLKRLVDFPNLWAYTREIYQMPHIAETVDMDHIKRHYYLTHGSLNPSGVVPVGPDIDFDEPHGRGEGAAAAEKTAAQAEGGAP